MAIELKTGIAAVIIGALIGCVSAERSASHDAITTQPIREVYAGVEQDTAAVLTKVDKIAYENDVWLTRLIAGGSIVVNVLFIVFAYMQSVRRAEILAREHGYWYQRSRRLTGERR